MKKLLFTIFAPFVVFGSPLGIGYLSIFITDIFISVDKKYYGPLVTYGIGLFVIGVVMLLYTLFFLANRFYVDVIEKK